MNYNHDQIKIALAGPIASVQTPFNKDGSISFDGLRRLVDHYIDAGASALLLTWGNSLFAILSDRDIGDITRTVVEYAAGRAVVVACTGCWATPQAVEFAAYCREIGADILQVFLPTWYPGCLNGQTIVDHHMAVAKYIPVMPNSKQIQLNGGPSEGLAIARELIERERNILAIKADVCGEYDEAITSLVKDHWTMIAGGNKSHHMELWPYGCGGWLSTFIIFRPTVAHAYGKAVKSGDISKAVRIIEKIDRPFFDYILAVPGGFDAAIHGIIELYGLAKRWRRPPFNSLNDEEMEKLAEFLKNLPEPEKLMK
ncbi:MAG: dihydrodipicolinate synthase family protein [Phycisphaerae bacterium]